MSETLPEQVERWELAGGEWAVVRAGEGSAVVDLMRCDGGEVVDRIRLTAPAEVRWAAARLRDAGEDPEQSPTGL